MIDPAESSTKSASTLMESRQEILVDWEARVREHISSATHLQHPLIINTVPAFIENLAEALAVEHPRSLATESSTISQEHGSERARLTQYGPDQLLKEYQLLRETILEHLERQIALSRRDRSVIQKSFDHAVQEGMLSFFLVHNRLREQFVAGLGHDLRNPIGVAQMAGDLILMAMNDEPTEQTWVDVKNLAERIVANSRRADRLIQNLLDASVIQFGERLTFDLGEHEILTIIKESIADFTVPERQRIHLTGSSAWGFWDGDALRRAIENLLTNAFKYGTPGTPITLVLQVVEGRMLFSVHNEGSPIPIEEQESLFQPFRRSASALKGKKQGWGLGLALVRSVSEGHGGSVVVDSSPEMGTKFTIDIPVDARPFQGAPQSGN